MGSYRQFTLCTPASSYVGAWVAQGIVGAALGAIPLVLGLIAGALAVGPAILAGMMIPIGFIVAYCRWWLYDRLICLGGDRCAVGRLLWVETPAEKSGLDAFDTDYSINLLLAPGVPGATQAQAAAGLQGALVTNQPAIVDEGLEFTGYPPPEHEGEDHTAVLHCEFEGGGVAHLLEVCQALLGYLAVSTLAAAIICAIPVIGWLLCLLISLLFAAIAGLILVMGMGRALDDTGNPNHVNANLGTLRPYVDVLVVKGTWVFDTAHDGWNEIHPIKHCQRAGTWSTSWEEQFETVKKFVPPGTVIDEKVYAQVWCDSIAAADSPATHGAQALPENQWEIHPVIDGCVPATPGDDPPSIPK